MRMRHKNILFIICLLLWALWWGGFTFYAAIVIPLGAQLVGVTMQGFITQQVSLGLNIIGGITLLLTGWLVFFWYRDKWGIILWATLVLTLIALIILHPYMDNLLNQESITVMDETRFYRLHRAYLWITTLQWLAGLVMMVRLWLGELSFIRQS